MNSADKKELGTFGKVMLIAGIVIVVLFGMHQCAKSQTYKGWQYDAQTQVLTLTFDFPTTAVKTLQMAGGLNDAKAIADKMGAQAAEGFRNVVSSASESKKGKVAEWFDKKATAAQKAAFELWVDTVGTFERNNPELPPTEGVLVPQQQGWTNPATVADIHPDTEPDEQGFYWRDEVQYTMYKGSKKIILAETETATNKLI